MSPRVKYLLALAGTLSLLGQGCAANTQVDINANSQTPAAEIDAIIDAEIDAAAEIDAQEREGDSDPDVVENDKTELNSYSEIQYDLP
jgi:hypothetical protein